MAANPTEIHSEFRNLSIRGSNVIPITESIGSITSMDMGRSGHICVERVEGTGSHFSGNGQMDRRSKYRQVKFVAKVAKERALPVVDIAFLIFWICFGLYLALK